MSRPAPNRQVLLEQVRHLGSLLTAGELPMLAYRNGLCQTFLQHFDCSRASLWRFVGEGTERRLRCMGLSTPGDGFQQPEMALDTSLYALYIHRLVSSGTFASPDVMTDPDLAELRPYFDATGVRSLMDSAFQFNGELFGAICLEETGERRDWTAQEQAALRDAVMLISLTMARMGSRLGGARPSDAPGDGTDAAY